MTKGKTGQGIIFIVAPLMGVKGVIMERTWRLRKGYVVMLYNGMTVHGVYPEQIAKLR